MQMYFGPCPPFGDKPHPYVITLIATDLAQALTGHLRGATGMVMRYRS